MKHIQHKIVPILFILLTALPAHADSKADPLLVQLYNAVNSISPYRSLSTPILSNNALSSSPSGDIMVNIILKTTAPDSMERFILNNNGSVGTSINGILTATVPLSLVPALAGKQSLLNIVLSRTLHPLLDVSVPAVQGDLIHSGDHGILPRPYTGRNVIIGIIDTGIDLKHPDFLYPDGSTRVIALWDQIALGIPPTGYSYGDQCTGYQINTGKCSEIDTAGHGTHVAGIADSSNSTYTGMAPDAMLVIVKTNLDEGKILEGINYIFSLASQYHVPAVINMSLGAQYYAHDNSSNTEQAIDSLVNQAPGRAIVVAAGNDGANAIHLGLIAITGTSYGSYFSVVGTTSGTVNTAEIQVWYYTTTTTNSNLAFALGVIDPSTGNILAITPFTTPTAPNALTLSSSLSSSSSSFGSAVIAGATTTNGTQEQNEILLQISDNGNPSINLTNSMSVYRYALFIQNNSAFAQPLNAWFDSENALFDTMTSISVPGYQTVQGDTSDTVSFPATARYAIAVGSFVTKNEWPSEASLTQPSCISLNNGTSCYEPPFGSLSFFSSKGPTPDPAATGTKPNITAPGEVIVSALSTQASFPTSQTTPDGKHLAELGTSMASPHVTGAIALLFDRNNGLDITQTMSLLGSSATTDTYTGTVPNNNWGHGMLNALNLVKSAGTTPTPATGPAISNVIKTKIGTSNAEITWSTDVLSTSYVRYWIASHPTGTTGLTGTTTMTEEHIVDLTGLNSNTDYTYQVISVDPYGNTSVYPPSGGNSLKTSKPSSSGCMCAQSGGTFNAGDLLPFFLLLLGWIVLIKLVRMKRAS
ncbi:MAG: S8 family serine peptidase [Deltaproteobacteria bacterium]|nr:S8 family serine peptidase [Deltaproteobacteria bacterium]